MNQFFSNKKLIVLLVGVIFLFGLLSVSMNQTNTNVVQGFTNDITAFVGRVFSKPANAVVNTFDTVSNAQDTFEENVHLKQELDQLNETKTELSAVKAENEDLREELNTKESITEHETIVGNVISRNPDNWIDQIVIDLGTQDGVDLTMPVMSNNGLIGEVTEVNLTSSKVTLLSNIDESANQVSAEIIQEADPEAEEDQESEEDSESDESTIEEQEEENEDNQQEDTTVIHGLITSHPDNSELLVMNQITQDTEVEVGETVSTSGLGGSYPRGLLIGEVQEVNLDDQGLSQELVIEPAANFNDIRSVSVMNRTAEQVIPEVESDTEEEE